MGALELVYQYRHLRSKIDRGAGLSFDEIEVLGAIEECFGASPAAASALRPSQRRFTRAQVALTATLRVGEQTDAVDVEMIGPRGLVCRLAPYFDLGATVEVCFDLPEHNTTYRFKTTVVSRLDDGDDYELALEFVGVPVMVRRRLRTATGERALIAA